MMAKHEFGIMKRAPSPGERYDTYEPERYGCISVPDEDLEGLFADLRINVYWHTLDRLEKGLAYCGITLIPPDAVPSILADIDGVEKLTPLKSLLLQARDENRFVIHYGL